MNSATANLARPSRSNARKLIIATLALVGCRIVSGWDSIAAGSAALVVLAVLTASIVAGMPRIRRIVLFVALPAATLANAVVFALGAFVVLLGAQGLLADGRIGRGPPWSWAFALVPLAAAANLVALAKPRAASRWSYFVWLVNLAAAAYAASHCRVEEGYAMIMGFAVPVEQATLIGLTILSLATIGWDTRAQASMHSVGRRRIGRRTCVLGTAASIICLLWLALLPVYHKRQIARSLAAVGLHPNFGVIIPGWRPPIELPFDCYAYVGEVNAVWSSETLKGDISDAGRLLNRLTWLEFISVDQLPADGSRILQPLAGHQRIRQIALKGAGVTDETLADAARLPGLNRAVVENARITDDGLANLANAQWLQYLAVRQMPISGEGLVYLTLLPRLTELDLSGTNVGDSQASVLPRFKTLSTLWLDDTPLTDDGLAALAQCGTLRTLDLRGTRVTAGGVERLERALPACRVVWRREADEP